MRIRPALLLLLPLLASCSLALSKGPPAGWRTAGDPEAAALASCSPKRTWGFVDTALSIMALASGYLRSEGRLGPDEERGEHILTGVIVGAVFGIGAAVGFNRADACEEFRDRVSIRSPGPDRVPLTAEANQAQPDDRALITADELAGEADATVLAAVERLRPQWLRAAGGRNGPPRVIVDNQAFELDFLGSILPGDVESVRFLQPADATLRWGTGYMNGAIVVLTRR